VQCGGRGVPCMQCTALSQSAALAVGVGLQVFLCILVSACTFGVYSIVIPLTWTYATTPGMCTRRGEEGDEGRERR
jgi:hypothetical protein